METPMYFSCMKTTVKKETFNLKLKQFKVKQSNDLSN